MQLTAAEVVALNAILQSIPDLQPLFKEVRDGIDLGTALKQAMDDATIALTWPLGQPKVTHVNDGALISPTVGQAATITGTDLLQGATLDSVTLGSGSSSVLVKANRPGDTGIRVALTDGASPGVTVVGSDITVTFRGATNGNVDNANAVAALINADATANRLVTATGGGTGNVTAVLIAAGALLGGISTEALSVKINGVEQDIVGTPTATSIPMVTKDLTGITDGDLALLEITSGGKSANKFMLQAASTTDFEVGLDIGQFIAEAGTWTASIQAAGTRVRRTAGSGAADAIWIKIPDAHKLVSGRGLKLKSIVANVEVSVEAANDVRLEAVVQTMAAQAAARSIATLAGDDNADYPAVAHDTAAERGSVATHRIAMVVPSADRAFLVVDQQLWFRFFVNDSTGNNAVVDLTSAKAIFDIA